MELNMSLYNDVLSPSWFNNSNENKNKNKNKNIDDDENFIRYANSDKETRDSLLAKRLAKELNKRSKECTLADEKIGLLESELQSLRTQLNSVLRVSAYNKSNTNNSIKHFHTMNKVASIDSNDKNTTNAAATVANLLVDELQITKNELENCQKELNESYKREQEYQTKLSSLYEELTNRTDELNSFGNSNVIEKTTKLREGILNIKSAMFNFDQGINNSTSTTYADGENFNGMRTKQSLVELELSQLTLTSSSPSMINYKELEHERNFLLSCVKDDNIKISELTKQVESYACKLRTSDYICKTSDQRAQQNEAFLNIEKENNLKLEEDLKLLKLENIELRKKYETAMYDSQQIYINFNKEINHSKELHDLNIELSDKIKTMEVSINSKNDDLKELKLKLNELNRLYGIIFAEVESNKKSIRQKESELSKLYEEKAALKQEYIDIDIINEDLLVLQKERSEILSELYQIRPIVDLVKKLESDLTFSEKVNSSANLSNSSVSRSHLLWTKLPSLAVILPNLQAHMHNLLEQVQHSELQFNNMANENAEIRRLLHNSLIERDTATKDLDQRDIVINDLNRRLYTLQTELSTQLGSRALLNQVKQCIAKYPEILQLLFDRNIDDIPSQSIHDIPHDISGNVSLGLATSGNIIEDSSLPDVISSIISFTSHYSKLVKPLRDQLDDVRVKYSLLLQENSNVKDVYNDANESMNSLLYMNEKLKYDASSFSNNYNEAKKVNSLLQDQLLEAKNEIAVKNAQLCTLNERENSMREILWLAVRKASVGNDSFPSSLTHLGVLLKYAIENFIIPDDTETKSKRYSSSLMTMTNSSCSTPITRTPQLYGTRSSKWSNESRISSGSSSPDFLSLDIKQQKSILFEHKESI